MAFALQAPGVPAAGLARIPLTMAYCPNCSVAIAKDAEDCDFCGTAFGSERWLPLDQPPRPAHRLAPANLWSALRAFFFQRCS